MKVMQCKQMTISNVSAHLIECNPTVFVD